MTVLLAVVVLFRSGVCAKHAVNVHTRFLQDGVVHYVPLEETGIIDYFEKIDYGMGV